LPERVSSSALFLLRNGHIAQIEALFCGKRYCLARCRDVHAGEKLIDHLERRAEADFRAEIVHLRRHGVEHRTSLGKGGARARSQNGQSAVSSARRAAADRSVKIRRPADSSRAASRRQAAGSIVPDEMKTVPSGMH
jgi:hypothetical protein